MTALYAFTPAARAHGLTGRRHYDRAPALLRRLYRGLRRAGLDPGHARVVVHHLAIKNEEGTL